MKKLILSLLTVVAAFSLTAGENPIWRDNNTDREFLQVKKNPLLAKKPSSLFSKSKSKSGLPGFDHTNLVIKWNLSQLVWKNLSFQAEFGFHPNISIAIGYSRLLSRGLPGPVYADMSGFSE